MGDAFDTIVVPARENTFQSVFLAEKRWYGINLRSAIVPKLRYLAVYRSSPISAITHWVEIDAITNSQSEKKYVITYRGNPKEIGPISNKERKDGKLGLIIGPRYTTLAKLKAAKHFLDACP